MYDLASLLEMPDISKRVYEYMPDDANTAPPTNAPWPIIWLLGRSNGKTVFPLGLPPRNRIFHKLDQFCRKLIWRDVLKRDTWKPPFKLARSGDTPLCRFPNPGPIEEWANKLVRYMVDHTNAVWTAAQATALNV